LPATVALGRREETVVIRFSQLRSAELAAEPFGWAAVHGLFAPDDAATLAATYPCDHFKTIEGNDREKGYRYDARSLIGMNAKAASYPESLSPAWRKLAADLLSLEYREAMSGLTGIDLRPAGLEVNVFHYGSGCWLGPHLDLKEKIVTHVFYFNAEWNAGDGGCLEILRSKQADDRFAEVPPIVGNSAVLARSTKSWHAVSRVREGCLNSRRSMTVTFYAPGSSSTMWTRADSAELHAYPVRQPRSLFSRLRGLLHFPLAR
jgi:hypothetical protein